VTLDQIQLASNLKFLKGASNTRPCFADVLFAVFGEFDFERRLLQKGSAFVIFGFEFIDL